MRRSLVMDDDPDIGPAIRAWLESVIDQCLTAAERHCRYVATLAAASNALSKPQYGLKCQARQ